MPLNAMDDLANETGVDETLRCPHATAREQLRVRPAVLDVSNSRFLGSLLFITYVRGPSLLCKNVCSALRISLFSWTSDTHNIAVTEDFVT